MAQTRFALILYFCVVACKTVWHTLSNAFFEIYEDMVQVLLMLKVLFTQNSEVEDLICDASSGSESSLFFSNNLFSLGLSLLKMTQHDFTWMTDEANGSVVLVEL